MTYGVLGNHDHAHDCEQRTDDSLFLFFFFCGFCPRSLFSLACPDHGSSGGGVGWAVGCWAFQVPRCHMEGEGEGEGDVEYGDAV